MEFRILGHLEATAGGQQVPVGGPTEQKLLAVLLLDVNHVVPLPRLVGALWEEAPPATAAKQARNAVSRLRRLLASSADPGVIETYGTGYRLAAGREAVDTQWFETRVAQAQAAASAGQPAEAARLLRSALDLWRGPFLAGLGGRVIEAAAAAWTERYCAVAETYYDHQLALGRHRDIVGELSALAAAHPLREKPVAQLMLALYRCGRQAEALAVYADTRALLVGEMGLDPGPDLRLLQQQILNADPALRTLPPAESPGDRARGTGPAPAPVPRQLPGAQPYFTGRHLELAALTDVLHEAAGGRGTVVISAIDGTAGIGKTALAVNWAHRVADRFPDGQLHVNLRGFDPAGPPATPAEVMRGFLEALGVAPERIPAAADQQAALYRSLLAGKRVLIVLDNARDAGQVRSLLPGSPGCFVLVTSRSQLTGLVVTEGAIPLTLDLLAHHEACELLARRLGRDRVASEPEAADELIELCARLPLALSIAAARAASWPGVPLAGLAAELRDAQDRLDALDTNDAASDMRAVFSWSYQSLSAQTARMFRALGVRAGPDISLAAAASLAGVPLAQARQELAELVRAHMLTEQAPGRFGFHDLLRAYAAERAAACDSAADRRAAVHRVLDHYLHTAHCAASLLNPPTRPLITVPPPQPGARPEQIPGANRALAWFEAERPALLAAITQAAEHGFGRHAWQLAWTMAMFFDRRGHWQEWAAAQSTALAAAQRDGDAAGQAHAHLALGYVRCRLGSFEDSNADLDKSLSLFRQLGDQLYQAHLHTTLSTSLERQDRLTEAISHARQALDLYRATGLKVGEGTAMGNLGWQLALLGDHAQAAGYCQQACDLQNELGNRHGEAATLDSLGYIQHQLGDYPQAIARYTRALGITRELGDLGSQAAILAHLGDTYQATGDLAAASDAWRRALAILDDLGDPAAEGVRAKLGQLVQAG